MSYQYDFFAQEWSYLCRACGSELYAPTQKDMWHNHWIHTHKDCLGGW